MARKDQHAADTPEFKGEHVPVRKDTEGGACLTSHNGRYNNKTKQLVQSSCNYRWQGFKRALKDSHLYNGKRPGGGTQWDVTDAGKNFNSRTTTPYWHESHHIVPNGELARAIAGCGMFAAMAREGLLVAKYNLNHMENMIILPMTGRVARALGLPRHRHTRRHRSHPAYSLYVEGKLSKVFAEVQEQEEPHQTRPDYGKVAKKIVAVSKSIRPEIEEAGGERSLDQTFAEKPQ